MEQLSPHAYVTQGFETMRPLLAAFVCRELYYTFDDAWWQLAVLNRLSEQAVRNLPETGTWEEVVDSLDILACLQLIEYHWREVFRMKMTREQRSWASELQNTRHAWAHPTGSGMDEDSAYRALDTMARLMEPIDPETGVALHRLMRLVRYKTEGASTEAPQQEEVEQLSFTAPTAPGYAAPWRQIAIPHPDVSRGMYRQAEFAADLSQVFHGRAMPEYQDAVEFFARTYITDGMRSMLSKAAERVTGRGGEPVIQLKTAFGGGKTHSMLALYHMMRDSNPFRLPGLADLLAEANIAKMPKVRVAVLVGTALDHTKSRRPATFPGITINTLWGEMVAQLAEQSNNAKLYDLVKEADRKGVSPGSETLREVLDQVGPCLILIDELVAYARNLYNARGDIPAGNFESVLTFIQALTEAVRQSKNSLLVASIPQSEHEAGGEAGLIALQRIEHIFGRIEAIWRPVVAEEGFEIVRRRLFKTITDTDAVDRVCNAFFDLYRDNPDVYPRECREADYLRKMKSCYPIHPELFERLYSDWATLENFQRTRGVLRFMATVIHDLYSQGDAGAMIMPGSINFGKNVIRDELIRYLPPGWDVIIDQEVDGNNARPLALDAQSDHYGRFHACRRAARAILLGSAPDVRQQRVRGLEASRMRLGVMQPGEQVAVYNDAVARLSNELSYLYSTDYRYWFDTRPTLRKMVQERAKLYRGDDVLFEVEKTLKTLCRDKDRFDGLHTAPKASAEIPDQASARLVLLAPQQTHKQGWSPEQSPALKEAAEMLNMRGQGPRLSRNALVFMAADYETMAQALDDMRLLMAWRSMKADIERENFDNTQKREIEDNLRNCENTLRDRVLSAYCWLLVPEQQGTEQVSWTASYVQGGESPVAHAARKLLDDDSLVLDLAPRILQLELTQYNLWKDRDYLPIRELAEYYARYLYLHRLQSFAVLKKALEQGISQGSYFAYADSINEAGVFENLSFGSEFIALINNQEGLLVKIDAARAQRQREEAERQRKEEEHRRQLADAGSCAEGETQPYISTPLVSTPAIPTITQPPRPKNTFYHGSIELELDKLGSTAGQINAEILKHLAALHGSKVKVVLSIEAIIPNGAPEDTVRTVMTNSSILKIKDAEFTGDIL